MNNGRMTTGLGVFLLFAAGAALIGRTPADSSQAGTAAGKLDLPANIVPALE